MEQSPSYQQTGSNNIYPSFRSNVRRATEIDINFLKCVLHLHDIIKNEYFAGCTQTIRLTEFKQPVVDISDSYTSY